MFAGGPASPAAARDAPSGIGIPLCPLDTGVILSLVSIFIQTPHLIPLSPLLRLLVGISNLPILHRVAQPACPPA